MENLDSGFYWVLFGEKWIVAEHFNNKKDSNIEKLQMNGVLMAIYLRQAEFEMSKLRE